MCTVFQKLCVEFNNNIAIVTQIFKLLSLWAFTPIFMFI